MQFLRRLTNKLNGARARRAAGTHSPHEDAEGMGAMGVRVERIVSQNVLSYGN